MLNESTAQIGQEEKTINENKGLVVAPTSHIMTPDKMYGLETLDREDITLPRIKLGQAMSNEVSNGNASDDEMRQLAEQFYHMMKKGNIKADDDEELPF